MAASESELALDRSERESIRAAELNLVSEQSREQSRAVKLDRSQSELWLKLKPKPKAKASREIKEFSFPHQ